MLAASEKDIFQLIKTHTMELTERIEAYLNGKMSVDELREFEALRLANPAVDQQMVSHKAFLETLQAYGKRKELVSAMNSIHEKMNVNSIKEDVLPTSALIRILWNKYKVNAAVAASVAIVAVFTSLSTTGYFSDKNARKSDITWLNRVMTREIGKVKKDQNEILKSMNSGPESPGSFGGTGFALTSDGYLVTNSHVVNGADSVYIQNSAGQSFKVKVVHEDLAFDVAILKVTDPEFRSLGAIPYTFKKSAADVGENVFTIGYPKDDGVLGKGYLSSKTGYEGDTTEYQVDISVNNGNSGGPLLDNKGNIIGVIKRKKSAADGTGFAVKAKYILSAIDSMQVNSTDAKIALNKSNSLAGLNITSQYKKLQDYIFMVKVYSK